MSTRRALILILIVSVPTLAQAQQPPSGQPLAAQQPPLAQQVNPSIRRTMAAVRMDAGESITLDGRLDEGIWMRAVPATNFIQQDPVNGQPATEQTEVRIIYNADKLYMGVTCFDSEPDKWFGFQRGRDGFLGSDDRFMWVIDTFLDGRTGYYFEMNPSGLMADALMGVGNGQNRQWDGIWTGRARRSDIGWTLEIEIPFRTLNFDPNNDTWGFNFQRTVRRKNEESLWMGWPRNQGLRRMSNTGLVTGIRDVTQGHGLDIKPYLVGTSASFPGRGDASITNEADVGVDFFYNVTPGLRANLTINTDFAQVEVDQRQVNLTRFSLLFPEKRDFFLDGSTFFDFATGGGGGGGFFFGGGGGADLIPFFSRRIGLDARGVPQKINFGGKVTGQVGSFDIGILQVQTGSEDASSRRPAAALGEDFTVGRVKRRILRQSYVGALYTARHTRGAATNAPNNLQTLGADFNLETSTFRGSDNLVGSGYFLHTTNPLGTGKSSAFGGEFSFPNDPWNAQIEYMEIQDNYDAAVGFTRRKGFRNVNPRIFFEPRPRGHRYIRQFTFGGAVEWFLDADANRTETREVDVTAFQMQLHSGDFFQFHVMPTYERLDEDFKIAPGVTLPVGREYSFTRYSVRAFTAGRRLISVGPQIEWGDFYSGDRLELTLNINVRARPGVLFFLRSEWNRVSLTEGQFYTKLFRGVSEMQFSPWMSLVNIVQYDTQTAVLGWQSRFRWIVRPGNDLYLVYLHNWLDNPLSLTSRFHTLDRRAASKVSYTRRF